jgi:hypothetical protein
VLSLYLVCNRRKDSPLTFEHGHSSAFPCMTCTCFIIRESRIPNRVILIHRKERLVHGTLLPKRRKKRHGVCFHRKERHIRDTISIYLVLLAIVDVCTTCPVSQEQHMSCSWVRDCSSTTCCRLVRIVKELKVASFRWAPLFETLNVRFTEFNPRLSKMHQNRIKSTK